jgi:hypothetical protein
LASRSWLAQRIALARGCALLVARSETSAGGWWAYPCFGVGGCSLGARALDPGLMDYRILGPVEVSDGDRAIALGSKKQRALLAVLLLHAARWFRLTG